MKPILTALALGLVLATASAAEPTNREYPDVATARVGLGQASANEPAKLGNLRLTDPLVQRKYLNEPDILRFLRATYSEACVRGMMNEATKQAAVDLKKEYPEENRAQAAQLMESRRIWKMTSFEMEVVFGNGYLTAANYCDCVMKEVSDQDMVNPRKGKEVVEKLSKSVQQSCEMTAKEQTQRQLDSRASAKKKK